MAIDKPIKDYIAEAEASNLKEEDTRINRMAALGNEADSTSPKRDLPIL